MNRALAAALTLPLIVTVTAACTSSKASSTGSSTPASGLTTSGSAATIDKVKSVLIKPADIPADTFTLSNLSPVSQSGAVGVSAVFANTSHQRVLSVILIHYPNASYAQAAAPQEQTVAAQELTHNPASVDPLAVGQLGQLYQGSNNTGPLSIVVFAEGAWVVTMEFISKAAGDSVPASVVKAVASKQDELIRTAK